MIVISKEVELKSTKYNRFIVDWDIKELAAGHLSANSWDGLLNNGEEDLYMGYPKKKLPEWGNISRGSY